MAEKEKKESGKKAIEYHKESVYGVHKNYYNDPDVAHHMHALTGMKTLHEGHIEHLKAMGHEVREVPVDSSQLQTGNRNQGGTPRIKMGTSSGYMVGGGAAPDDNAAAQP